MANAHRANEAEKRPAWPDAVLENLARAIHREYVRLDRADAQPVPGDPATAPWEELPKTLQRSSRDQAAHVLDKLDAVGCDVRPSDAGVEDQFEFEPDEVEFLARVEHRRWVEERRRDGWVHGPRDPLRRTTPYLVPWEDLSEEMREYDRMFVRQIPALLAQQGCGILRRRRRPKGAGELPLPNRDPDE
jgi:hypothetical protein